MTRCRASVSKCQTNRAIQESESIFTFVQFRDAQVSEIHQKLKTQVDEYLDSAYKYIGTRKFCCREAETNYNYLNEILHSDYKSGYHGAEMFVNILRERIEEIRQAKPCVHDMEICEAMVLESFNNYWNKMVAEIFNRIEWIKYYLQQNHV